MTDDGHFTSPGGEADASVCPSRHAVVFPDEVGTWETRGRARILHTTNLGEVLIAGTNCAGQDELLVRHYSTRVRVSGDRLDGQQVEGGKLVGAPASARIVSRLVGTPGTGAPPTTAIDVDRVTEAAERCGRRIVTCFRR